MNKMLLITGLLICAQNVDAASNQRERRALQNLEAKARAELRRELAQQAIANLLALRRTDIAAAEQFDAEDALSAPASPVAARRPLMGIDELTPSRLILNNDGSPKTAKQMRIVLERLSPEELLGTAGLDDLDEEIPSLLSK